MKKALSIITIAAVVVACNSNPQQEIGDANVSAMKAIDTVGLAEYHTWKAQKDMADFNEYKQSKQSIAAGNVASQPALRKAAKNSTARPVKAKKPAVQSGSGSAGTTTSYPAKAPEKKGWSKSAKGAVIGAGSGAVVGAVVNKRNRAVGAVIGGVAGGAVGYGVGRHLDKKDGRY